MERHRPGATFDIRPKPIAVPPPGHSACPAPANCPWPRCTLGSRVPARSIRQPTESFESEPMNEFKLDPDHVIADEESLRGLFHAVAPLAVDKCIDALDAHAQAFIRRSPFVCLGTQNADGRADVSPRGDPPGFVRILDPNTLAIPDRPGNNRLDSLANIVSNPNVGLLFVIPGFDDTLRVNGEATLVTDPGLLDTMAVRDRAPGLAIVVRVREVFMHCAKAFRRSQLWNPDHFQDRDGMPSLSKIILDQTTGAPDDDAEMRRIDADLEVEYGKTLY